MDLIVRAGLNDEAVIADACAAPATGLWLRARPVPMHAVVVDASNAAQRPRLEQKVGAAGLPFLVDPQTFLFQDVQAPDQSWARLPFASPEKVEPGDLRPADVQDELIDRVIGFQRDQGATVLIPPYFYAASPTDPWFELSLSLLNRTAHYLARENIGLPVAPVLAASLHQFAPRDQWQAGIDAFLARTEDLNTRFAGISLSWSNPGHERSRTLRELLSALQHAAARQQVVAWRQGLYGPAAVCVGAVGYECGLGGGERVDYPTMIRNRRPSTRQPGGGAGAAVYLGPLGRSLSRRTAKTLLDEPAVRAMLVCPEQNCCPDGVSSMIRRWREHALQARARELADLRAMPSPAWQLNHLTARAEHAITVAQTANDVLKRHGMKARIPADTYRDLAAITHALRTQHGQVA